MEGNHELNTLLSAIISEVTGLVQLLNSCAAIQMMLVDEYDKRQKELKVLIREKNISYRRYIRLKEKYLTRRPRINWKNPGRTDLWWVNLRSGKIPSSEWQKNFRMSRGKFRELVNLLAPFLSPEINAVRTDCLTAEKKVAMCLYYLKDQGGYRMTCNSFGVSLPTMTSTLQQFFIAVEKIGFQYLSLPRTKEEIKKITDAFEDKFGFPQVVGCIDGTHIPIKCPPEKGNEYFCYKMKYTINVQAICDEKGLFLDVDASWPGSTHDAKVYKNCIINSMFQNDAFRAEDRTLIQNMEKVPLILLGDPAYPLLPNVMKEYESCFSNDQVLFNEMLRSTRNMIECAFGRLKARWRILMRPIDIDIQLVPSLIYTCFVLHNFCEVNKCYLAETNVHNSILEEKEHQTCEHHECKDPIYTYRTKKGEVIRDVIKTYFSSY